MDWDTAKVTFTTKLITLRALGLLNPSSLKDGQAVDFESSEWVCYPLLVIFSPHAFLAVALTTPVQAFAKIKLVVAVCIGGTDYNSNARGRSFGMSRQAASKVEKEMHADALMTKAHDSTLGLALESPY